MTSQLNVDTIVDKAGSGGTNIKVKGSNSTYVDGSTTQNLIESVAKVHLIGSNAASPVSALNVSSGVDNGTGDYTYNITNALSSASAMFLATAGDSNARTATIASRATTSFKILTFVSSSGGASDHTNFGEVNGDLA